MGTWQRTSFQSLISVLQGAYLFLDIRLACVLGQRNNFRARCLGRECLYFPHFLVLLKDTKTFLWLHTAQVFLTHLAVQCVCVGKGWHSPCSAFLPSGAPLPPRPQPPTVSSALLLSEKEQAWRDAWRGLGITGSGCIITYHFTGPSTQSPLPCRQAGKCTTAVHPGRCEKAVGAGEPYDPDLSRWGSVQGGK